MHSRHLTTTSGACVRVTLAASVDGLLFGSRVIALWLSTATSEPPPTSCAGDGIAYEPAHWEDLAPRLDFDGHTRSKSSIGAMAAFATVGAILLGVLVKKRAARYEAGSTLLPEEDEYPEPPGSPGSQRGADGEFPAEEQ